MNKLSKHRLKVLIREELTLVLNELYLDDFKNVPADPYGNPIKLVGAALESDPDFRAKVNSIANTIGANPNDLMNIMKFESGLDPSEKNPDSDATGLIQFMPTTARDLGTTIEQLADMDGIEQLDYVKKYFRGSGPYKSGTDLYLKVFYPYAIRQNDDYVIGSEDSQKWAEKVAADNPSFLVGDSKTITKKNVIDKMEPIIARSVAKA